MTDNLVIDSNAELQLDVSAWPIFDIAASAIFYPSNIPTTNGLISARL